MRPARLDKDDADYMTEKWGHEVGPGLYQCCPEVYEEMRERVTKKENHPYFGKDPSQVPFAFIC